MDNTGDSAGSSASKLSDGIDPEVQEMYEWVLREKIDWNMPVETMRKMFYQYKNKQILDKPGKPPTAPHGELIANSYENFLQHVVSIQAQLDKVRLNMRYHIDNPNLLADLNLVELHNQLNDIEARALRKDATKPKKNFHPLDSLPDPNVIFVNELASVANFVDSIHEAQNGLSSSTPLLYIDAEGVDLSRNGSLTLIQIYLPTNGTLYILDIQTLGAPAFEKLGTTSNSTLRSFLESEAVTKVFWECRTDSDALFAHHAIVLAGVIDAQLVENATNGKAGKSNRRVLGLMDAVGKRLNLLEGKLTTLSEDKELGRTAMREGMKFVMEKMTRIGDKENGFRWLCTDSKGEENQVAKGLAEHPMTERPLHPFIMDYCAQDVLVLPLLLQRCMESKFWSQEWADRVKEESGKRLELSRSDEFLTTAGNSWAAPQQWWHIERVDQTRS